MVYKFEISNEIKLISKANFKYKDMQVECKLSWETFFQELNRLISDKTEYVNLIICKLHAGQTLDLTP